MIGYVVFGFVCNLVFLVIVMFLLFLLLLFSNKNKKMINKIKVIIIIRVCLFLRFFLDNYVFIFFIEFCCFDFYK